MPGMYQELTVKFVGDPYIKGQGQGQGQGQGHGHGQNKGQDVFVPVIMFGDPKRYRFEMKITKTIWHGIYKYLKELEDDPMNTMLGDCAFKIDEELSFLKDRIVTIRGVPDMSREFITKTKSVEHPKVFEVTFRGDLEETEREGGETYRLSVFKYVIDNFGCRDCRILNTALAREEISKKEMKDELKKEIIEKDKEIKEKDQEIKEREKGKKKEKEVVADWSKKKIKEDKKKIDKIKKMDEYWSKFA